LKKLQIVMKKWQNEHLKKNKKTRGINPLVFLKGTLNEY